MCGAAYTPYAVTYKPKIYGVSVAGEAHPPIGVRSGQRGRESGYPYVEDMEVGDDLQGDIGVLFFWYTIRVCVFNVHVVDTDADTYVGTQLHKSLAQHERHKKCKYLEACLKWRQKFMPMAFLVDGVTRQDIKVATKQLADELPNKWDHAYFAICEYVRARLLLILIWAFRLLVRDPRSGRPHTVRRMSADMVEEYILVMQGY